MPTLLESRCRQNDFGQARIVDAWEEERWSDKCFIAVICTYGGPILKAVGSAKGGYPMDGVWSRSDAWIRHY